MSVFIFVFFLLIIVLGIRNYIIASVFKNIAFQKGYDDSIHSFAMCFCLGMIGCLYIVALPDLKTHNITKDAFVPQSVANDGTNVQTNAIDMNTCNETNEEKMYKNLIAKAEKFKDTFYDRDYRIRTYESIIKDMEILANKNYKDSATKLQEYTNHLNLLKERIIK